MAPEQSRKIRSTKQTEYIIKTRLNMIVPVLYQHIWISCTPCSAHMICYRCRKLWCCLKPSHSLSKIVERKGNSWSSWDELRVGEEHYHKMFLGGKMMSLSDAIATCICNTEKKFFCRKNALNDSKLQNASVPVWIPQFMLTLLPSGHKPKELLTARQMPVEYFKIRVRWLEYKHPFIQQHAPIPST